LVGYHSKTSAGARAMGLQINERQIHRVFETALILKALHSLMEIVGGILLAGVSTGTLLKVAEVLTSRELHEDPNDLIANYILHLARTFSIDAKAATVFFLLSHGTVKLILVLSVMRGFSWAYPAFMLALGLLIAIQTFQLSHQVSLVLLAVTVLDVIVLALTWHEYRLLRGRQRISEFH
jgi:uncharacterized membrane protein